MVYILVFRAIWVCVVLLVSLGLVILVLLLGNLVLFGKLQELAGVWCWYNTGFGGFFRRVLGL